MLCVEKLDRPAHRDRAWRLYCNACGATHPEPISKAAAHELAGSQCFACEVDPGQLEWALVVARAEADRN